jgi:hypothetical protein
MIDALNVRVATLEGKTREDQMAKERMARERMAAEQRLAAERKFNQLYVAVQGYFETDEAEVYKQENQLVIRLKAMRFPVGKASSCRKTTALLSKVQKAIRTFDDPRVIVEGHTDTTGSERGEHAALPAAGRSGPRIHDRQPDPAPGQHFRRGIRLRAPPGLQRHGSRAGPSTAGSTS